MIMQKSIFFITYIDKCMKEVNNKDIKVEYKKIANAIPKIVEFISHQLEIIFQRKKQIKLYEKTLIIDSFLIENSTKRIGTNAIKIK